MDLREIRAGNANRHPWEIARASAILSVIPKGQYDQIVDVEAWGSSTNAFRGRTAIG